MISWNLSCFRTNVTLYMHCFPCCSRLRSCMCRWWTSSLRPRRSSFTTGGRCGDDSDVRSRGDYREADTPIDVSKGWIRDFSFTSLSLGIFPITMNRHRALRWSPWHSFQVSSIYHIHARIQDAGKVSGISDWSRFGTYVYGSDQGWTAFGNWKKYLEKWFDLRHSNHDKNKHVSNGRSPF